jgi:hypothetical protein
MPVPLQFHTCLKNAIMYARRRLWPTCRCMGGGCIFVWTRLPFLNPPLISLTCSSHTSGSSSTSLATSPVVAEPSTSPPSRPTSPLTLQLARRVARELLHRGRLSPVGVQGRASTVVLELRHRTQDKKHCRGRGDFLCCRTQDKEIRRRPQELRWHLE